MKTNKWILAALAVAFFQVTAYAGQELDAVKENTASGFSADNFTARNASTEAVVNQKNASYQDDQKLRVEEAATPIETVVVNAGLNRDYKVKEWPGFIAIAEVNHATQQNVNVYAFYTQTGVLTAIENGVATNYNPAQGQVYNEAALRAIKTLVDNTYSIANQAQKDALNRVFDRLNKALLRNLKYVAPGNLDTTIDAGGGRNYQVIKTGNLITILDYIPHTFARIFSINLVNGELRVYEGGATQIYNYANGGVLSYVSKLQGRLNEVSSFVEQGHTELQGVKNALSGIVDLYTL